MTTQTNQDVQDINRDRVSAFYEDLDENYELADAKKLKDFVKWEEDSRGVDPDLTVTVIEQFGVEGFLDYAEDVARHGITGGFSGFVYYTETEAFYVENKSLIKQWAKNENESMGIHDSLVSFVASFGSMQQQDFSADEIGEFIYSNNQDLDNFIHFANNMTWAVGEAICYGYSDFIEEYDDENAD